MLFNCAAQTAMTFALGGLGFWIAAYLQYRRAAGYGDRDFRR